MSRSTTKAQSGFTIIEVSVSIVVVAVLSLVMVTFVNTTLKQYLGLQKDATAFSDLAMQSHRITNVLRGSTDISEATSDSVTVYAYFYPNNQYVSLIRYYLNGTKTTLYADVTPMNGNPPIGAPIIAGKKTYTIIPYYYAATGKPLFQYKNAAGTTLTTPIADLSSIKSVQITLTTPSEGQQDDSSQSIETSISLRNRKTNL